MGATIGHDHILGAHQAGRVEATSRVATRVFGNAEVAAVSNAQHASKYVAEKGYRLPWPARVSWGLTKRGARFTMRKQTRKPEPLQR